jgi:hypothetical protein
MVPLGVHLDTQVALKKCPGKHCVARDDDRHFDRPWRGDVALSPRRYGSCRDALPDEWGHVTRERSGGRR